MIKAVVFDMFETLVTLYNTPLTYQGREIAKDICVEENKFREIWNPSEDDRTIGKTTFEKVILQILNENNIYSEELFNKICLKRKQALNAAFNTLHPEIISMLKSLKQRGIKIALITNCFFEEREAMKQSEIWQYIDCPCLSCELGIKKPDLRIFEKCLEQLKLLPEECLYIGDGGSRELETARSVGMKTAQACWYLKEGLRQPVGRMNDFVQLDSPMDVCKIDFS